MDSFLEGRSYRNFMYDGWLPSVVMPGGGM